MLKGAGCMQVVVVANPANTNAVILSQCAPSIPRRNITCLTRLDHNRALGQVTQSATFLDIPVLFFAAISCPWVPSKIGQMTYSSRWIQRLIVASVL